MLENMPKVSCKSVSCSIVVNIIIDGKRPDGITLVYWQWQCGKPITWDVTVVSTLAQSYLHALSHLAGGAAKLATSRMEAKYASAPRVFFFSQSHLNLL